MATPYFSLDLAAFRLSYPAFKDNTAYPDETLRAYFTTSSSYLANDNYGWLKEESRYIALTMMTAHIGAIGALIASGETPGLASSGSVDKTSVTLTPPPMTSQFHWWLNITPYGQQLLALLQMRSAGGFSVGGSNTRGGFRGNAGYLR